MADIIVDGTTVGANRFLLLDSTGKIPAVDGSQVITIAAGNIATGTIPIARIDTGTTANKIVKLDGNAKLPALDGSLITNMPSATKNASDPTISTNPSGGVGTDWHNTTSGEAYICTDATAGENVWKNIGAGTGDIEPPPFFQGTQHGYVAGGDPDQTRIERFSLTSQANSVDIGDLATNAVGVSGGKSSSYGFVCGGDSAPGPPHAQISSKYAFASSTSGSTHGTLTVGRYNPADASSETHVYCAGGNGSSAVSYTHLTLPTILLV